MEVRLPPPDPSWLQAWNAFGPYLVALLVAVAVLALVVVGRRRSAKRRPPPATRAARREAAVASATCPASAPPVARTPPADPAAPRHSPAAARGMPPTGMPPAAPPAAPHAVLVVDDSAVVRTKLRKLLEGAGYRVVLAHDGAQALAALPGAVFSLLITDLEMPNMDGLALIAHLQARPDTRGMPIIAISGHEQLQAHVREVQGLHGLFRKPWDDGELLRQVAALVAARPRPAAAATAADPALH